MMRLERSGERADNMRVATSDHANSDWFATIFFIKK